MGIGDQLKTAREQSGLTQIVVGERCDLDHNTISEFESGKREPRFSQLAKLAEVYRLPVSLFFEDQPPAQPVVLWRERPEGEEEIRQHFLQLCRQYYQLELWTGEQQEEQLPSLDLSEGQFHYPQVMTLAKNTRGFLGLGDRPGETLHTVLEEVYGVKIFHLDLGDLGSAACAYSEIFGNAVLLNSCHKRWRRNFDLAHELFHFLTWNRFRHNDGLYKSNDQEEKYANCFASNLLIPEETVRNVIEKHCDKNNNITFNHLDAIARQFDVSLEALLWRVHFLCDWEEDDTRSHIDQAKRFILGRQRESGNDPLVYPERYRFLAKVALQRGEISLGRFAQFMNISRRQAQSYLVEGEPVDAKISIATA